MASRNFYIGETVNLRVRVSFPGTRTPAEAAVSLTSVRRAGSPIVVTPTAFTRLAEGEYLLGLQTDDLDEGTYDIVVTVIQNPQGVVIVPDRFVLKAA